MIKCEATHMFNGRKFITFTLSFMVPKITNKLGSADKWNAKGGKMIND